MQHNIIFASVLLAYVCVQARLVCSVDTATQLATLLSQPGWLQQGGTVAIIDPVEGDEARQVTVDVLTQRGADGRPEVTEDNVVDKLRQASKVLSCLYGISFRGILAYIKRLVAVCPGMYLAMPLMAKCVKLVLVDIKQSETMTSLMISALSYFYEASPIINDRWMHGVLVNFQKYTNAMDLPVKQFVDSKGVIDGNDVIFEYNTVDEKLSTLDMEIAGLMNSRCVSLGAVDVENDPLMIENTVKMLEPLVKTLPGVDEYRNQYVMWLSAFIIDKFNMTIRDRYTAMGFIHNLDSNKSTVVQ